MPTHPASSPPPLHVLIVGAGLGGTACAIACRAQGFRVTLLDQVTRFAPLGDSIGLGPNVSRLLGRWDGGFADKLAAISSTSESIVVHDYRDGRVLGVDATPGTAEATFGHRSLIGHRGHYHMLFLEQCEAMGVEVRSGARVVGYDVEKPSVTLEGGEEVVGDVVVAADGVKSLGRKEVLGYLDEPVHSGYAVYRAFMEGETFRDDPLTAPFVENGDSIHLYLGPDLHGFVTCLRDGKWINAVLTHKDDADIDEGWSFPGKKSDILPLIKDWDPGFRRIWEKMEEKNILDWKLVYRPCLKKWVTDSGKVAIMGDAAHPFVPTSVQGASQAMEDGATIAKCLAKANGDVPLALHTFFELRYEHVAKAQGMGLSQREKWHNLHDKETGEMKQEFDMSNGLLESYVLFSHDCEKVVDEKWDSVSAEVKAKMERGEKLSRE
ncbi:FAD/NAD(P)-binding domain-containing protein [Neofusicoccum parvum]|nr:FAD/NAD(P)-binding domain-containing protein [Neofusicoccum parvum]